MAETIDVTLSDAKAHGGVQQVPDYGGFAIAHRNGVECWRLRNDTGAALVLKTPYFVDESGTATDKQLPKAVVLADNTKRQRLVVALEAVPDNAWGWFAYRGYVEGMIVVSAARTTGHALKVLDAVVTSTGAVPDRDDEEFGVNLSPSETATTMNVWLNGREFLNTT